MIEPGGLAKPPTTLTATFSPANKATKVSVDLGKGSVSPLVLSNNALQLRFRKLIEQHLHKFPHHDEL